MIRELSQVDRFRVSVVTGVTLVALGLIGGSAGSASERVSWIDLRLDSPMRPQMNPWERQLWGDDPMLSSQISHGEVWSRVPEILKDEDRFIEQWQSRKQNSSEHPREVLKRQRVHVVESAIAFSIGKRLVNLAAFNESGRFDASRWDGLKKVSEFRVSYAVRSILIEIALQMKLIRDKSPGVPVHYSNTELYARFVEQFGNEKDIEILFDWKERADQLGSWIEKAQKQESPLVWGPTRLILPQLPKTLDEFESLIRSQLQLKQTDQLTALIDRERATYRSKGWARIVREYSGVLPKRAEMVAADLSLIRQTAESQAHLFREWELSIVAVSDGGPMSESLHQTIKEFDERKLNATELLQLKNRHGLKGWNQVKRVRLNSLGEWGAASDGLSPDLRALIPQITAGLPGEGQVLSTMIPAPGGLGWLWVGVLKVETLPFSHPGVQAKAKEIFADKVNAFVLRESLRVALSKSPASYVGSVPVDLDWPEARLRASVLISKILPVTLSPSAPQDWANAIRRGDQVLKLEDLSWVENIPLDGLNRLILEP